MYCTSQYTFFFFLFFFIFWLEAYLNTVVTVGKVVHGLELLVNDTDASLVRTVGDLLDVLGGLAQGGQLLIDDLGRLDRALGVEFGCFR